LETTWSASLQAIEAIEAPCQEKFSEATAACPARKWHFRKRGQCDVADVVDNPLECDDAAKALDMTVVRTPDETTIGGSSFISPANAIGLDLAAEFPQGCVLKYQPGAASDSDQGQESDVFVFGVSTPAAGSTAPPCAGPDEGGMCICRGEPKAA